VTAYTYLFRDEYPRFSLDPGRYPVLYEVDYPEKLSRWLIFVKWVLVIPHQVVLSLLSIVGFLFGFFAFFGILFTGRYPRTFFNFNIGLQRWSLRVAAYSALLRDEFPPYSKRADAGPGSRRAIILSAIFGVIGAAAIASLYALFLFGLGRDTATVQVSYSDLRNGAASEQVDLEGVIVTLESVADPYEEFGLEPDEEERLVAFELEIRNTDAIFAFIDETSFEMEDTAGDEQMPHQVFTARALDDLVLTENERADVTVIFTLDEDEDPAILRYSPVGPIPFFPLGKDVRFEFE
jgi:hypothetical protein